MPIYCYSLKGDKRQTRHIEERMFDMGKAPKTITYDGMIYERDIQAEQRGFRNTPDIWPIRSESVGVNPEDARTAEVHAAKAGVPTDFDKQGRAIFRSRGHRRAYCNAMGVRDNDAGYSDAS